MMNEGYGIGIIEKYLILSLCMTEQKIQYKFINLWCGGDSIHKVLVKQRRGPECVFSEVT